MNFHVVTLFPEAVTQAAKAIGVVGQAIEKGALTLDCVSPREFTANVHHTVDDRPFGGGDGMIMMAEPLSQSLKLIREKIEKRDGDKKIRVIHVSPRGTRLDDAKARELSNFTDLILVSSRYGGADQRFLNSEIDEEISIGDYILTGGELAVLVLIDAVGRLQAGVLGNDRSASNESFAGANGLLEHPQFTRPREWNGQSVPEIYMSGDHGKIAIYQEALSVLLTAARRPDLLPRAMKNGSLTVKKLSAIVKILQVMSDPELEACGIGSGVDLRVKILNQLGSLLDAK